MKSLKASGKEFWSQISFHRRCAGIVSTIWTAEMLSLWVFIPRARLPGLSWSLVINHCGRTYQPPLRVLFNEASGEHTHA